MMSLGIHIIVFEVLRDAKQSCVSRMLGGDADGHGVPIPSAAHSRSGPRSSLSVISDRFCLI